MVIQQLLVEARTTDHDHEPVSVDARGAEAPADWDSLRSPENYTGYERTGNFASPRRDRAGQALRVSDPGPAQAQSLGAVWRLDDGGRVRLNEAAARIAYRFHARDLHLVMGPAAPGTSVRFRVRIDGQPPGAALGADVDHEGNGTVAGQRLHQLIRQPHPPSSTAPSRSRFSIRARRFTRSPSARSGTPGHEVLAMPHPQHNAPSIPGHEILPGRNATDATEPPTLSRNCAGTGLPEG